MKIFIIEDNQERIQIFKEKFNNVEGAELFITTTASEAKKVLEENKDVIWDIIFLDHDLGGRVFVESADQNTGYQVAKFIRDNKIEYYNAITHSLNTIGAENIKSILKDCSHIPFTVLQDMEFSY